MRDVISDSPVAFLPNKFRNSKLDTPWSPEQVCKHHWPHSSLFGAARLHPRQDIDFYVLGASPGPVCCGEVSEPNKDFLEGIRWKEATRMAR